MSLVEVMSDFFGSSGNQVVDFIIYSLAVLYIIKLVFGIIRSVFKL